MKEKTVKVGKYEMLEAIKCQAYQEMDLGKARQLSILIELMKLADNEEVPTVYWEFPNSHNMNRGLVMCEIPSLVFQLGWDFDSDKVASILRGIQINFDEDETNINVQTTYDLNSATIEDLLGEVELGPIQ